MKRTLLFLLTIFVSLSFATPSFADNKNNKLTTVVFSTGLHCENCKKKIESNIAFEKGVKDLQVDLANKTVTVTYRTDKTTSEKLQQAISKLGYTCLIKEEKPAEDKK